MSNLVITISRDFGSGGRLVGEKLALRLGIPFYDKSIIKLAAEKSGLSPDFIERSEEQASNSFLFNLVSTAHAGPNFFLQYDTPVNDKAFFAQAAVIREIAERDSCVIVGRCADYVLREHDNLARVFIYSSPEDKVRRAVEEYGIPAQGAEDRINKINKGRANYYKYYTGEVWGSLRAHDLSINTSFTGIDGAVDVIMSMLKTKQMVK